MADGSDGELTEPVRGIPGFADRLNAAFRRTEPALSNERAAELLGAKCGVQVSSAYLSMLRTGKQQNPSAQLVAAIARLFRVPIEAFRGQVSRPGRYCR